MSALARVALVLHLMTSVSCLEGDTCLKGPEKCQMEIDTGIKAEASCEEDMEAVEDADAIAADVSLMQKDLQRIQPSLLQAKNAGSARHWRSSQQTWADGSGKVWPSLSVSCKQEPVQRTQHMTLADYDLVVAQIQLMYDRLDSECSADSCPQSDWTGCLLRLAAHDFMDRDNKLRKGGADGCLFLPDEDNKGLNDCLDGGSSGVGLLQAYSLFCNQISLADFIVIGAEAVMNITRQNVLRKHPDRRVLEFRSRFKYGRVTSTECHASIGKMPDAERGCNAIQETLVENMGLTWNQSAALMGGHTLGEASSSRSGYNGRWKTVKENLQFDNGYYTSLLLKGWGPEQRVGGNGNKNQWKRVDLGVREDKFGHEIMLDTDMCLFHTSVLFDVEPNPLHASMAAVSGCSCAWTLPADHMDAISLYNNHEFCGISTMFPAFDPSVEAELRSSPDLVNQTKQRLACCGMLDASIIEYKLDCGSIFYPKGNAAAAVALFAKNESAWLDAFHEAWDIATTNGFTSLTGLGEN